MLWLLALLLGLMTGLPGRAGTDPASLCDSAALRAAEATGVPVNVLRAIALSESGQRRGGKFRPWPWTLNKAGEGRWFDDAAQALEAAQAILDTGHRNLDIGCFQINHRWHAAEFVSLQQMLDPEANALYAARFLAGLARELGDWSAAAGAYHSRTPGHATRYRAIFDRHLAGLGAVEEPAAPQALSPPTRLAQADRAPAPRPNHYPLLLPGGVGQSGSLFPAQATPALPLLTRAARPIGSEG